MVRSGRHNVHALNQQGSPVLKQLAVQIGRARSRPDIVTECHSTQAELFASVCIDHKRRLEFAETFISGAKHDFESVLAGSDLELVFIVEWLLLKFFHLFFAFEVKIRSIAKARGDRAVGLVYDSENIHGGMLFAFYLLEF